MPTRSAQDYVETISPQGYVSNREITNLPGVFLVKGSKNVRVVNKEKVASIKRFTLKGAAKDVNRPIVSSFDWKTNTNEYRHVRGYLGDSGEVEVWYNNAWRRVKNGYQNGSFEWFPIWDDTEQLDLLIGVRGDDKLYMWSGGVAEVASVTANTITKKGYLSGTTIAFNEVVDGNDTITDSNNGFLTAGFAVGDSITIQGSGSNDGDYTIKTVTAGTITLIDEDTLLTEAAGASVVVKHTNGGTWAEARFLTALSGRSVNIGGINYTYTGGEDTGTLTGLARSPQADGITAGDYVMQDIVESEPATLDGRSNDLVSVQDNQLWVVDLKSRTVYISAVDDYTDFSYTTPLRVPGEGYKLTLDSTPTALVPAKDEMYVSAGDDDWYRVFKEFTDDQGGESVIVKQLDTAPGQAAISQGAVGHVKNNVAFVSVERTFDTLGNVENIEGVESVPLSDDILNDMEAYDFTNVHVKYHKRSVYIALPAEGLVLEYDFKFKLWQPPYELPVRRLAIIDNKLCGHSNNGNETYILFDGYNDNGAPFKAVAAFGYENFGARFTLKNFNEVAVELYLSRNTVVTERILYDYKGATDVREFEIDGSDESITFAPNDSAGLGKDKLGNAPLGGTLNDIDDLVKARAIDGTGHKDFFERQRIFESESLDCRFEIIAYGENVNVSDNDPDFIKR